MDIQTFKLSKTGKIIIIIIVVIVILFSLLVYIAAKKQREISKQTDTQTDTETETVNADGQAVVSEDKQLTDKELEKIFDDYLDGKYAVGKNKGSAEAVKASGLSTGAFYRKLRKYEQR